VEVQRRERFNGDELVLAASVPGVDTVKRRLPVRLGPLPAA